MYFGKGGHTHILFDSNTCYLLSFHNLYCVIEHVQIVGVLHLHETSISRLLSSRDPLFL